MSTAWAQRWGRHAGAEATWQSPWPLAGWGPVSEEVLWPLPSTRDSDGAPGSRLQPGRIGLSPSASLWPPSREAENEACILGTSKACHHQASGYGGDRGAAKRNGANVGTKDSRSDGPTWTRPRKCGGKRVVQDAHAPDSSPRPKPEITPSDPKSACVSPSSTNQEAGRRALGVGLVSANRKCGIPPSERQAGRHGGLRAGPKGSPEAERRRRARRDQAEEEEEGQRQGEAPGSDGDEQEERGGEAALPGQADPGAGGLREDAGEAANGTDPEESIQNPQAEGGGLQQTPGHAHGALRHPQSQLDEVAPAPRPLSPAPPPPGTPLKRDRPPPTRLCVLGRETLVVWPRGAAFASGGQGRLPSVCPPTP